MSLRKRLVYFTIFFTIFLIGSFFMLSDNTVVTHIKKLETEEVKHKLNTLDLIYKESLSQLKILTNDWAIWDDTYDFVLEKDTTWANKNFGNNYLNSLQLDYFIIIKDGKVFSSGKTGFVKNKVVPIDKKTLNQLKRLVSIDYSKYGNKNISSLFSAPSIGPVIFSARKIVRSHNDIKRNSKPHNTLIFIKKLNNKRLKKIQAKVNMSIEYSSSPVSINKSSREITSHLKIKDVFNKDHYLNVTYQRKLYTSFMKPFKQFVTYTSIMIIFFPLCLLCLFKQ